MTTDSPITDADIEAKKAEFEKLANESNKNKNEESQSNDLFSLNKKNKNNNFNEKLFDLDAKALKDQAKSASKNGGSTLSLDSLFVGKYIKSDKDDDKNNNHNNSKNPLSFNCFLKTVFIPAWAVTEQCLRPKTFMKWT